MHRVPIRAQAMDSGGGGGFGVGRRVHITDITCASRSKSTTHMTASRPPLLRALLRFIIILPTPSHLHALPFKTHHHTSKRAYAQVHPTSSQIYPSTRPKRMSAGNSRASPPPFGNEGGGGRGGEYDRRGRVQSRHAHAPPSIHRARPTSRRTLQGVSSAACALCGMRRPHPPPEARPAPSAVRRRETRCGDDSIAIAIAVAGENAAVLY
ncbi:hypothetical protein OF83DRAFT_112138 [Amylostereum chailletii]|nr:hypothetical protein OF83DRAFT_112138 [Amylostereum chailletii]